MGQTPLHAAAGNNKNPAVIQALLDAGADITAGTQHNRTPLHLAAIENENVEVLKVLLTAGADIKAEDDSGKTPLQLALESNEDPAAIRALEEAEDSPDVGRLADELTARYGLAEDEARGFTVKQFEAADGQPLVVAFSYGLPPSEDTYMHRVSVHAVGADSWDELARVDLECVSYLEESWLEQVDFEPNAVWMTVRGGTGAHGKCFELVRWDGAQLDVVISHFSGTFEAGSPVDLNGDGQLDLLLDISDSYIFCYACGVTQYLAELHYWDGEAFVKVVPTPLTDEHPENLKALNNRAIELANASLYADALAQIEQAEAMAPGDTTVAWNAVWIRHHLEGSRREASRSKFPLLGHVFAGDWEAAFDLLWEIGLPTLISDTPIPEEFVAVSSPLSLGAELVEHAAASVAVQPERAAIHALGAWGRFLIDPTDASVHGGFQRAAEIAPDDSRYDEIVAAFDKR